MTKQHATGTITRETRLIPLIYDAPGESIPVTGPKISFGVKACAADALSLGFKFAHAVRVKVKPEGGGKTISFSRETEMPKTYLFAEKIISRAELNADQNAEAAQFRRAYAQKLADPDSIIYKSSLGLGVLDSYARARTVLITREGERLYRPPGAKKQDKAPAL